MASVAPPLALRRAHGLVLLAVVCVVLGAAIYLVAVQTARGQRLDDAALEGRAVERTTVQEATGDLLATISVGSLVLIGGTVMLVALVQRRPHLAVAAGVVILGANLTTQFLKEALPRPDLVADNELGLANSLPSGHTTVAMSLAVAVVLVVPPRLRGLVALCGTAYGVLIGVAVVTGGWHRPSDVLAADTVAIAWGALVAAYLLWRHGSGRRPTPYERPPIVSPVFTAAGITLLLLAFVALAATVVAVRYGRLATVDLGIAYATSLAAIVGFALVLMAAFLHQLRGANLDPPPGRAAV